MSLNIDNIYLTYRSDKVVLDHISINVEQGQIVGLLGPNGAGKTSLFSIIVGEKKPTAGNVFLDGHDLLTLPIYRRAYYGLSYLPQESSIFRGLTVEENILAVLELRIKNKEKRYDRLEELITQFKLEHLRDSKARYLSGGERRRVEIARAIATEPKFLLLDEPLAAMDPITINQMKMLILQLKTMRIGILITDHNVKDTLDIIDLGYILYDGKLICQGPPEVLIHHQKAQDIYFGTSL